MHGRHGDDGESLIHFKQVNVVHRPAGFFQHFLYRTYRRGSKPAGFLGMCGMCVQDCQRRQAAGCCVTFPEQNHGRRAVRYGTGICGRHGAVFGECRFQCGNFVEPRLARLLVGMNCSFAFTRFNHHRFDFFLEFPLPDGCLRTRQRLDGVCILHLPGKTVFARAVFRERPHQLALVVSVLQAVKEHVIHHLPVSQAQAAARLEYQVRCIAHALHSSRDDTVG